MGKGFVRDGKAEKFTQGLPPLFYVKFKQPIFGYSGPDFGIVPFKDSYAVLFFNSVLKKIPDYYFVCKS